MRRFLPRRYQNSQPPCEKALSTTGCPGGASENLTGMQAPPASGCDFEGVEPQTRRVGGEPSTLLQVIPPALVFLTSTVERSTRVHAETDRQSQRLRLGRQTPGPPPLAAGQTADHVRGAQQRGLAGRHEADALTRPPGPRSATRRAACRVAPSLWRSGRGQAHGDRSRFSGSLRRRRGDSEGPGRPWGGNPHAGLCCWPHTRAR